MHACQTVLFFKKWVAARGTWLYCSYWSYPICSRGERGSSFHWGYSHRVIRWLFPGVIVHIPWINLLFPKPFFPLLFLFFLIFLIFFFILMLFLAVPHFLCFMLNTLSTPFLFSMGKSAHVLRRSCPINRSYLKARKKINFLYIGGKWTATRVYSFHQVGGINKRLNSVAYVGIRLEYLCWPSDYYKLEEIAENSFSCLF